MEEPDNTRKDDAPYYSTLDEPVSRRSTPGRSVSSRPPSGRSTPGRSTPGRSTPDRSTTPEPPPVPPATYHWEEVRRQRSVGGYPWTHLNKPAFDENTWVKYERDHVYEPVTPAASTDRISAKQPAKDDGGRHFLRIPLTEELVMADDTGSEPEGDNKRPRSEEEEEEEDDEEEEEDDDDDDDNDDDDDDDDEKKLSARSDESIYEGENENSSVGETADASRTRIKMFQQKVKVKADILRAKLQGVTKRKPKQKISVDGSCNGATAGEKSRRKFGQFATLPKKFTFNAPKVDFSAAFGNFSRNSADATESSADDTKSGRFSLPRFGFAKTASESPKPRKTTKIGTSRLSIPGLRARTWSDASKASKPGSPKPNKDFGTYPRIFSKRRKTNGAQTPPPPSSSNAGDAEPSKRKDSFRRRFFRSHKESTPAPTEEQAATLAVEEELDEAHVSKESLAEFGDSDLQEVISLSDECSRSAKDTKSLSEHRPGVIEEIDSDEFFLREKGLSRGDVQISNYLSSEIRDVFRSHRTRSVEVVNNNNNNNNTDRRVGNNDDGDAGSIVTPVRPSRTNSLRRPARPQNDSIGATATAVTDRFSTMPKSFGGTRPSTSPGDDVPENIITSRTFEPSDSSVLPSAFRVPWRTAEHQSYVVEHMPPKPPTRQRTSKFSTFDTRSMIDLSRKRSQSQIGFLSNFSEAVPKAPLRRSRASLVGSERDVSSTAQDGRPSWAAGGGGSGAPTPPLRRSRMSLTADADERWTAKPGGGGGGGGSATPPARPPPPVTVGYATVDKTSLLVPPPQSPARHRRKKSYDVIKSEEFGAFFTVPRSYSYSRRKPSDDEPNNNNNNNNKSPPSRPARAYNTLGPSRPLRRRLPVREHEYGDVADDGGGGGERRLTAARRSSSPDDGPAKALCSGDVIEMMKLRPLPSPPPPPRSKSKAAGETSEPHRRRDTDSAVVPFLDRRETSATSSNNDLFADVSRALLASAAENSVSAAAAADDVSVGVQTDPLPDESDDVASCCSADSERLTSRMSARPASSTSTTTTTEYVDRPTSRISTTAAAVENGYVMLPDVTAAGVICAHRISVDELRVGKMTVADVRGGLRVNASGSNLQIAPHTASGVTTPESAAAVLLSPPPPQPPHNRHRQDDDDAVSVQSSMYPEVDSDEDRTSLMGVPTPPRRRSKPATRSSSTNNNVDGNAATVVDPSVTELSCQLFRLCHSNVCNLFNKVVQQVVPEDTEKRRDLQAALCFLSIVLAGLLILGFGNEKTIHHHHWDFQFPPSNQ